MWPVLPLPETARLFAVTAAAGAAALWAFPPGALRTWLARGGVAAAGVTTLGLWLWGSSPSLAGRGVQLAWTTLLLLVPFVGSLVPSAFLARRARLRESHPRADPARPSRRALLQAGATALPLSALAAGGGGFAGASSPQRIPVVPMRYPWLPPDLEGLKILHLSDLHLGAVLRTPHLEALLDRADALCPDLVALTGDVADDPRELAEALRILHRRRPRLGVFAALGNHEYLHDIRVMRPIYEESPIPLLVDRGVTLPVGRAELYIAGADDPIYRGDEAAFLDRAVARSAAGAPADAFRLLLCHRPDGFVPAAARGFHLTLSGHTHGGQVGLFGVSAFQALMPERFLWGPYERAGKRLYTTSGFGHWFPFRLGCPTEAPLIVLAR